MAFACAPSWGSDCVNAHARTGESINAEVAPMIREVRMYMSDRLRRELPPTSGREHCQNQNQNRPDDDDADYHDGNRRVAIVRFQERVGHPTVGRSPGKDHGKPHDGIHQYQPKPGLRKTAAGAFKEPVGYQDDAADEVQDQVRPHGLRL